MARLLYRLGALAARRAKTVIAAWLAALAAAVLAFAAFGGTLTDQITMPDMETTEVADRLAEELPDAGGGSATAVVRTEDGDAFTQQQRQQVAELIDHVEAHGAVEEVSNPFAVQQEREDGRAQLEDARQQLEEMPEDFDIAEARAEIDAGRAELEQTREQLDAGWEQLESGLEQAGVSLEELPERRAEVEDGLEELDQADAQIDAQVQQALAGGYWPEVEAELNAARAEVVDQREALQPLLAQLQQAEQTAQQLEEAEEEWAAGSAELDEAEEGLSQLEEAFDADEDPMEVLERNERLLELTEGAQMVSPEGDTAILMVTFTEPLERVGTETLAEVSQSLTEVQIDGAEVLPGGDLSLEMPHLFSTAEAAGLVIAAVVLLVMLGTFIGAGLPLLNAVVGVGIGVCTALAFSSAVEMMSMTPVLGLMLGLAVGIDYALFIINRHRRQLKDEVPLEESIALANGTAGNAVVFAGATVVIALLALNVTGLPFLALMGTVAAFCVAVAVLMATTMTPALLKLVGWRILRRKERRYIGLEAPQTAESKVTAPMGRLRAVGFAVVSAATLALLAVPAFDMRLAFPDAGSDPEDSASFQSYVATEEAFGQGMNGPLVVAADLPEGMEDAAAEDFQLDLADQLASHEHVDAVVPIALSEDNSLAAYQVIPVDGPAAESTEELVHQLRGSDVLSGSEVAEAELSVAGMTAAQIDISDIIAEAMPVYLGLVIGLSLLLMIMVFRSLLLPVVATVGFIGSLAGSIGVVVAVFQWGWFSEIFGIGRPGPVMTFLPILMIGILFGLAMDYQLFTASGMREAYAHGSPPRLAVRRGLHAGRAVVTAAALIMSSVFAGFVFTPDPMIASIGLGLAAGVLLDAFVVRLVLVPSVLSLLGPAAWWIPGWLDRILPDVDVEGAALTREAHSTAA
ncbi:MMPL family transporter [Nesterenkonia sp.]|uniref:MMPL family transporter n=1 Tax=Nesterenkonia sp. TaxID=704201 RepID=UPI0026044665|nr:MMPL family transporter [Nesterenkonia sp.]